MKTRSTLLFIVIAVNSLLLTSCVTIAKYNAASFQHTAVLKARTIILIGHADTSYAIYSDKIDSLLMDANALYAMEIGRSKNENTINQWNLLIGSKTAALSGFFSLWKQKKKLPEVFIDEAKPKIAAGFDEILKLEGAKLKN